MAEARIRLRATDLATAPIRTVTGTLGRLNTTVKALERRFVRITWLVRQFTRGVRQIARGLASALDATERQTRAEVQLGIALSRTTRNAAKATKQVREYARELSNLSGLGDEEILEVGKVLAEFGFAGDQLTRAITGLVDRSLQVGRAPIEMARILGKFASGVTNEVGELGVAFERTGDRAEDVRRILEAMGSGEIARALGQLPIAKWRALRNTIEQVKEAFGEIFTRSPVMIGTTTFFQRMATSLRSVLSNEKKMKEFLGHITDVALTILQALNVIVPVLTAVITGVLKAIGWFERFINTVKTSDSATHKFVRHLMGVNTAVEDNRFERLSYTVERLGAQFDFTASMFTNWIADILEAGSAASMTSEQVVELSERMRILRGLMGESVGEDPFGKLNTGIPKIRFFEGLEDSDLDAIAQAAAEHGRTFGSNFSNAFSVFWQDSLTNDVGIREAWQNLGEDLRRISIDTFAGSFASGFTAEITKAATALAKPFALIGRALGKALFSPIMSIAEAFANTVTRALAGIIGQAIAARAAAAKASVAEAKALAAILTPALAGPATLMSIIMPGAPPLAATQISKAIAAVTAASSVGLAEGGVVMPRAGGVPVTVAEAGEPEIVAPLSKAPELLAKAGGMGGAGDIHITINGAGVNDPEMLADLLEARIREVFSGGLI